LTLCDYTLSTELKQGAVYTYSLWQVLADGRERELHDPELEIGF
jgi:hypothetical protein